MIVSQDGAKASRDRLQAGSNVVRMLGPLPPQGA